MKKISVFYLKIFNFWKWNFVFIWIGVCPWWSNQVLFCTHTVSLNTAECISLRQKHQYACVFTKADLKLCISFIGTGYFWQSFRQFLQWKQPSQLFVYLPSHQTPSEKGSPLKWKSLLPPGSNYFILDRPLFRREVKSFWHLSPLKVYHLPLKAPFWFPWLYK